MLSALFAFLGAFTLFLFEPFLGKAMAPRYGGGAQVWVLCLLYFQIILLLGYVYGHFLGRLSLRRQVVVHCTLLLAALSVALIRGANLWLLPSASDIADPMQALMTDLALGSAMPLLLLAATSPLAHRWYTVKEQSSPYHLYAWSNAGSLFGLLAYPFVIEPWLSHGLQAWLIWALLLGVLLLVALLSNGLLSKLAPSIEASTIQPRAAGAWILWGALGSAALVAATTKLTLEVGSIPLLWCVPLLAYLLSFILVFDGRWAWESPRLRPLWMLSGAVGLILLSGFQGPGVYHPIRCLCGSFLFTFALGLVCHGQLYRQRPGADQATIFLIASAVGGVVGGLIMALGAPLLLDRLFEVGILALAIALIELSGLWFSAGPKGLVAASALILGSAGGWVMYREMRGSGLYFRNFYGVVHLDKFGSILAMTNLQTLHGIVDRAQPERPMAYYTSESGLGISMAILHERKPAIRVSVVGLGVGTAAAYAKQGDTFEFLELNPIVAALAGPQRGAAFPFLSHSKGTVHLRIGDGRTLLESDRKLGKQGQFDLILLDAFSGDSVPWHLLTKEALALYLWHLSPDGILLVHVSNPLPVDLVVLRGACSQALPAALLTDKRQDDPALPFAHSASHYVIIAKSPKVLNDSRIYKHMLVGFIGDQVLVPDDYRLALMKAMARPAWRDDRSSLTDLVWEKPLDRLTK